MIVTPSVPENEAEREPRRPVFDPDAGVLAALEDDEKRFAAIARRLRAAGGEAATSTAAVARRFPGIAVGQFNVIFGEPHGARIEPPFDKLLTESGVGSVHIADPPADDLQRGATASVWAAFAAGAHVVRIESGPAAGAATLFRFLAADANEHGFADGVLYVTDSVGPAGDVAQRLATQIYPGQPPRYYSRAQFRLLSRGRAFLVLLLRSRLTAADITELRDLFPEFRFVIDGAIDLPGAPSIELGALPARSADRLFDERVGVGAGANDRGTVRRLCASVGSLPASVALVGRAARELPATFQALVAGGRGDDLVRAFIASRPPIERRILGILALAQAPLTNCHLCYILGVTTIESELRALAGNELLRVCGPDTYELSQYVAERVIPLADTGRVRTLLAHIFSDVLDRWARVAVLDRQVAGAEALLERADSDALDDVVLELGPLLARMHAIRGAFGGWGRVLRTIERAALRAGDTRALTLSRHDLGVRALLLGRDADAGAYLRAAVAGRQRHGDADGARASANVLKLLEPQVPGDTNVPPTREADAPAPIPAPPVWVESREPRRPPIAALEREFRALERRFVELRATRWFLPAALCFAIGAFVVGGAVVGSFLRPAVDAGPEIVTFSAYPRVISAGRSAAVCVDARDVAVVEIFPTATHFSGSGNHCVGVSPRVTTAYVAVGSAADGRQVRAEILVSVLGAAAGPRPGVERVSIAQFAAQPARIRFGQSTRLCYAAIGARALRMVPAIGKLVRLQTCETVTPRAPGRYAFTLSAIGDGGQLAVRQVRVDVLPAGPGQAPSPR